MEANAQIDWDRIERIIERYDAEPEALLMIIQDIGDVYHYLPPEVVPMLARRLGVRESVIYSVATFYKSISLEPRGKYLVHVCRGTACHVRGAERVMEALQDTLGIREGDTSEDRLFSLEAVRCLGCCASGPVIMVNQNTHGGLDRVSVVRVLEDYRKDASA